MCGYRIHTEFIVAAAIPQNTTGQSTSKQTYDAKSEITELKEQVTNLTNMVHKFTVQNEPSQRRPANNNYQTERNTKHDR